MKGSWAAEEHPGRRSGGRLLVRFPLPVPLHEGQKEEEKAAVGLQPRAPGEILLLETQGGSGKVQVLSETMLSKPVGRWPQAAFAATAPQARGAVRPPPPPLVWFHQFSTSGLF